MVVDKQKKKLRPARLFNIVTREVSYVRKGANASEYVLLKADDDSVELEKAGNLPGDPRSNAGKPPSQTAPPKKKPPQGPPQAQNQDPNAEPEEQEEEQPPQAPQPAAMPSQGMVLPTGSKAVFQQSLKAALDAFLLFTESIANAPEAVEGQPPSPPEHLIVEMNKVGDLMGKALESYPGLKISHGKPEPVAPTDDSQPTQPADGQDPAQNKPQEVSAMAKHDEILAQCEDLTKELNLVNSLLAKFDAPVTPVEKSETETQPEATSQVVDVAKAAADAVDAKLAPILTALTAMQNDVRAMKSRTASSAVALDGGIRVREVTESPAPRRINGDLNEYFAKLDAEKAKGR
jgi:hypothetical protein